MTIARAKFEVGRIVHHRKYDYRGVIFDVDSEYLGSDEWYDQVARSRPPKDEPWYHVLVHEANHTTYVAEQHLEPDESGAPIRHQMLDDLFVGYESGRYTLNRSLN